MPRGAFAAMQSKPACQRSGFLFSPHRQRHPDKKLPPSGTSFENIMMIYSKHRDDLVKTS
jgi:hypothetical protein